MYRYLKEKDVENIPAIKCMGDVFDGTTRQETLNDSLCHDKKADQWRRPVHVIPHMIHYRIVTELLIPIGEVQDARELLLVGRDILNGGGYD